MYFGNFLLKTKHAACVFPRVTSRRRARETSRQNYVVVVTIGSSGSKRQTKRYNFNKVIKGPREVAEVSWRGDQVAGAEQAEM